MTDSFEKLTKRLQETVNTSRQETSLLLNVDDEEDYHQSPVPVITKICSILSKNLAEPIKTKHKSLSEQCIFTKFQEQESRFIENLGNISLPNKILFSQKPDFSSGNLSSTMSSSFHSAAGDCQEEDEDKDETSLGQEILYKEYFKDHENKAQLWDQMIAFRQEYQEMQSEVDSILTRLRMEFSNMTREASCNFVLLLSQMGCPSCSTGNGLEACSERLKALEAELDRAHHESLSLKNEVELALKAKNQIQGSLCDRNAVIQSLTETIETLQTHCLQLEESSSDVAQWEELIVNLEAALRSIGRLVIDDSETDLPSTDDGAPLNNDGDNEEEPTVRNWSTMSMLADKTVTAVRLALARHRTKVQQLQSSVNESQQRMLLSDKSRGDSETREHSLQREVTELRFQLSELTRDKQMQKEGVQQAERSNKMMQHDLEEKEKTIRQLRDDLHREKLSRQRMEETLDELRHEEALQRNSHAELYNEFQQLSCDNQLCRSNIATFEERLHRLRKEMDQVREERTRLSVALDFSKDERNHLTKQLKEMEEKLDGLKDHSRTVQMEKMSVEDSLSRLQVLKSLDEAQLHKLKSEIDQFQRDDACFLKEKEELEGEVAALKHELVKAEELRMRLESFSGTMEHSLNICNGENMDLKEQLDNIAQINDQLTEKQTAMEQRYAEIETSNNHLMEEITKLTREFSLSKEREKLGKEEVDRFRQRVIQLEEEIRIAHEQLLSSQNVNQLTQVSMMATQTNYDELRLELERVTKEMQALGVEKEELLTELQILHESTNAAIAQLQEENKQMVQEISSMVKELHDASNEKAIIIDTKEKEKQETETKLSSRLSEVQQEHKRYLESLQEQQSKAAEQLHKEMEIQASKLQEEIARRENDKQQQIALAQVEIKSLEDKLRSTTDALESERKELDRIQKEDTERQFEHKKALEEFRIEINRLHGELRSAGETRAKEIQTAEQILAVTSESLKRSEQDLSAARADLTATNRELKEAQRQVDSLQIQLSKMESQRDEARKDGVQRGGQVDEIQSERNELRNSVVTLQSSIKRLETDREDVIKCLEEARKRIAVLEESRGVLEREIHHLRTLVKDGEQQVARLTEDLNISQQKLERSQDVQNRWKERSEALVEQLQAEQNRTILAEQSVTKYMSKIQSIKMHYQQLEQQYNQKLHQSGSQQSLHQQRLDEMDLTVQKTIARSKRLEEERHNFHSRLIETDKEIGILKNRLREADAQAQELTDQLHRLEHEKRELNSRFGVLYSTLRRFIRVLEDGTSNNSKLQDSGSRFIQPLSATLESEMSMMRDTSATDPDAIQIILQDLMRHILQLQARRAAEMTPSRDEPTRLETIPSRSNRNELQRQLVRQLRDAEGNTAGLREQLHASLNTVASHVVSPQTLHRESTRLDGLVAGVRRFDSSPIRPDGSAP